MPRKPETPDKPARNQVKVLVHDEMLAYIDSARGSRTRARFVRDLIRAERRRNLGRTAR